MKRKEYMVGERSLRVEGKRNVEMSTTWFRGTCIVFSSHVVYLLMIEVYSVYIFISHRELMAIYGH